MSIHTKLTKKLLAFFSHPYWNPPLWRFYRSIAKGEWQEIQPPSHVERVRFFFHQKSLQLIAVRRPLLLSMDTYFLLEGSVHFYLNSYQRNRVGDHLVATSGCAIPVTLRQLDLNPLARAHVENDFRQLVRELLPMRLSPVAFVRMVEDERKLLEANRF